LDGIPVIECFALNAEWNSKIRVAVPSDEGPSISSKRPEKHDVGEMLDPYIFFYLLNGIAKVE
jgi:hypothetical protein